MPEQDLRARLVKVGVELVASEGTEALSLREIARRAGVSHGAPRRYFPTHVALLGAIALEGYQELGVRVAAALGGDADPRARLLALGRLYLEFAATNSGMFALMFRHDLLTGNGVGLREASKPLFGQLVRVVAEASPDGDAPVVAGALWANLHGIAQLSQWGSLQVALGDADVDALVLRAVDAHLGGS